MPRIAALFVLAFATLALPAQAQLFRAYVSSTGSDGNPCTLAAPCRLLPAAINAVRYGGDVWMLDSANYNTSTVFIGKSVNLLAVPGAVGSLVAVNGPAVHLAVDGPEVSIRNVTFVSLDGSGNEGVRVTGASRLSIEDCVFTGFPNNGVYALGGAKVSITASAFRSIIGISVLAEDGATINVSRSHVVSYGGIGIFARTAGPLTQVVVSDSTISGTSNGVAALASAAGATARANVSRSTLSACTSGALAATAATGGTATLTVDHTMVTGSTRPWGTGGVGVVQSLGNNHFQDNANAGSGNFTTLTPQ